jgi:hypothetical protein
MLSLNNPTKAILSFLLASVDNQTIPGFTSHTDFFEIIPKFQNFFQTLCDFFNVEFQESNYENMMLFVLHQT